MIAWLTINVLTYNLWHGLGRAGRVTYQSLEAPGRLERRRDEQIRLIGDAFPTIGFFQETNPLPRLGEDLATALNARVHHQIDAAGLKILGFGVPRAIDSGLATTVPRAWPLRDVEVVRLSHRGPLVMNDLLSLQVREERLALMTEVTLPGGLRLLLVNTHLHDGFEMTRESASRISTLLRESKIKAAVVQEILRTFSAADRRRRGELNRLLRGIETHEKGYDAVLLAGDFNSDSDGELPRTLSRAGFRDAWRESKGDEPGWTYDPKGNSNVGLGTSASALEDRIREVAPTPTAEHLVEVVRAHEGRAHRFDYLWIKARRLELRVERTELFGVPPVGVVPASDHFGVMTALSLRSAVRDSGH